MSSDIAHRGYFAERIVVVPNVTKDVLESTVSAMAEHGFIGMP
jgi:hypothetical protein